MNALLGGPRQTTPEMNHKRPKGFSLGLQDPVSGRGQSVIGTSPTVPGTLWTRGNTTRITPVPWVASPSLRRAGLGPCCSPSENMARFSLYEGFLSKNLPLLPPHHHPTRPDSKAPRILTCWHVHPPNEAPVSRGAVPPPPPPSSPPSLPRVPTSAPLNTPPSVYTRKYPSTLAQPRWKNPLGCRETGVGIPPPPRTPQGGKK